MDALCIVDVIVTAGPLPVLVAVVSQFDCDCNSGGVIADRHRDLCDPRP